MKWILSICLALLAVVGMGQQPISRPAADLRYPGRATSKFPAQASDASIRATALAAYNAGGGTVVIPAGVITLSASLPLYNGVAYEGTSPSWNIASPSSELPDGTPAIPFLTGTVLQGNGSFDCFSVNTTPASSPASDYVDTAWHGAIRNLAVYNFRNGVNIGAQNVYGCTYSEFTNLTFVSCANWSMQVQNFMHCTFKKIRSYVPGYGQFCFTNNVTTTTGTVNSGNGIFEDIFGFTNSQTSTWGICFWALGPGSQLNAIRANHIQCNNYNRTQISTAATCTNGSPNITLASSAGLVVGMPVNFSSSVNGFTAGQVYVIYSITGNVVQVANNRSSASPINATGTSAVNLTSKGNSMLDICAWNPTGASADTVECSDFTGIDLEGYSSAVAYFENVSSSTVKVAVAGIGDGLGEDIICARSSGFNHFDFGSIAYVLDFDGNSNTNLSFQGKVYSFVQACPGAGIINIGGSNSLKLTTSTNSNGDLFPRWEPNQGQFFLFPGTPIGTPQTAYSTAPFPPNASQSGLIVLSNSSTQTFTLPTITNTNATNSTLGETFHIINSGAGTWTVNTNGTQLFNGVTSKTSYSVPHGSGLICIAAIDPSGTLFWAAFPTGSSS